MLVLRRGLLSSNVSTRKRLAVPVAPTPLRRLRMIRDMAIVTHEPDLLASTREVYSRLPETRYLEPWELQHVLYSLNYTNGLAEETDVATAIEVARSDWTPDEGAA
jgi:hypothetical protein